MKYFSSSIDILIGCLSRLPRPVYYLSFLILCCMINQRLVSTGPKLEPLALYTSTLRGGMVYLLMEQQQIFSVHKCHVIFVGIYFLVE